MHCSNEIVLTQLEGLWLLVEERNAFIFILACLVLFSCLGFIFVFRSSAHFRIGLFVFLILSCMSCLYILEINPLLAALLANIFSHSEGCLFVLFMVSFAVHVHVCVNIHIFVLCIIYIIN